MFFAAAAARQLRDAEQNRRREELQRRIQETRLKLQNVSTCSLYTVYSSVLKKQQILAKTGFKLVDPKKLRFATLLHINLSFYPIPVGTDT